VVVGVRGDFVFEPRNTRNTRKWSAVEAGWGERDGPCHYPWGVVDGIPPLHRREFIVFGSQREANLIRLW
jgi:hypothetical protein